MTKDGIAPAIDSVRLIRSLFTLIPLPIAVADDEGNIVIANSFFADMFQGVTNLAKMPEHEIHVPGQGTFEIHRLPLNDQGFEMVYATDVGNEVQLRRQMTHLDKMAAIGRLVTGVAQEIDSCMSDIRALSPLVSSCQMDDASRDVFNAVFAKAAQAGNVTRNLLSLAGEKESRRVSFDLNEVVECVAQLRRYRNNANSFEVTLELDPNLPRSTGDPAQIEQVVLNLLVNAEAAVATMDRNPGVIHVRTVSRGARVQLHVADNGAIRGASGVLDGKTKGVDLSLCSEIVKDHGGDLYAWSAYGSGSTFTVELPARTPESGEVTSNTFGRCLQGKAVMVVDDEAHITQLIRDVLERHGARVHVSNSGSEAYDSLRLRDYDLIICDQRMPGMSGQNLFRLVEDWAPGMHRRFLFITGDVVAGQTKQFFKQAGVQFLRKPFRIQDLLESIENLFSQGLPQSS